jgi:hypothetical protein
MSSPIGNTLKDLKAGMQCLEEMMMCSEEKMKEKMKCKQDHQDETERQLQRQI